jgi:hypothetical protein
MIWRVFGTTPIRESAVNYGAAIQSMRGPKTRARPCHSEDLADSSALAHSGVRALGSTSVAFRRHFSMPQHPSPPLTTPHPALSPRARGERVAEGRVRGVAVESGLQISIFAVKIEI